MNSRKRISLDGTWLFQIDPTDRTSIEDIQTIEVWREAQVPMPWQAQFDDLRLTSGTAWYRRQFSLFSMDEVSSDSAVLHFGAVDYQATVWLNGQKVGDHEGGYLPFEFDVADMLRAGANELAVRVVDPGEDHHRWPDVSFSQIPHGKQSWYGPISGIWQSVWLELRPRIYLQRLRLTPIPAKGSIEVVAPVANIPATGNIQVHIQVADPNGVEIATTTFKSSQGSIQLDSSTIALWSPDSPALYTVSATLLVDGQAVDELSDTCGFRTIEARAGRIYLNGEPIYLRGVLDQAYYPETIYTPPSVAFLEDQVRKAKALGLNCLRCHIKIEDPRYYEVADRLGILIWTEIPNWIHLSSEASQRAKETFAQMVERDWNHPSIFAWTLINENWGTDLVYSDQHRRWLADFYYEAKALDPTRLIVDNSACQDNFHVVSDVEDYHHYRAIPDHAAEWDQWVADFARRADWAWAEDYSHERCSDLPLIVSEFGNWGLPDPDKIQEKGEDPWWFETGHDWGDGVVYPHAMQQRFESWKLDTVFGDFDQFIKASQEHMARSLAYEIATMRLETAIGGYVITEFTDVHWECNGLLDMQRNLKQGLERYFSGINRDRVVVVRPQRWSGRPGEVIPVEIRAFGVDGPGREGRLQWQVDEARGELPAPGGLVQMPLPRELKGGLIPLRARWIMSEGGIVASNQVELAYTTPPMPGQKVQVIDDEALSNTLKELGYDIVEAGKINEEAVLVARQLTPDLQKAMQRGADLLLIAGPDFAAQSKTRFLPMGLRGMIIPREGTLWQGDWATSFSWLKKRGPFAHLPGGPLLEMEYADIMPEAVLVGMPAWLMRECSWAGLAIGWIHKVVSLLVRVFYGQGSLTVTTFKLSPAVLEQNVIAQGLLAGLVSLAGGTD